jgi:hypothetical protein
LPFSDSSTVTTNASREEMIVCLASDADNMTGCPYRANV